MLTRKSRYSKFEEAFARNSSILWPVGKIDPMKFTNRWTTIFWSDGTYRRSIHVKPEIINIRTQHAISCRICRGLLKDENNLSALTKGMWGNNVRNTRLQPSSYMNPRTENAKNLCEIESEIRKKRMMNMASLLKYFIWCWLWMSISTKPTCGKEPNVLIKVTTNPGATCRCIDKSGSGGELFKNCISQSKLLHQAVIQVPTIIDEVDTG